MTFEEDQGYVYLYGIVRRGQALPELPSAACDGIREGALVALIERVAKADFQPDVLEERMKSLEWVGPQARKHDRVLELAGTAGPVVPARLCTLFTSEAAVRSYLVENQDRLGAALDRLCGREEWAWKVYLDQRLLRERLVARSSTQRGRTPAEPPATARGPGQAYLVAKHREAEAALAMDEHIDGVLVDMLAAMAAVMCDSREKSLLSAEATGQAGTMVLNVAALVEVTNRDRFRASAEQLAAQFADDGFRMELSGPWTPYSFTDESDPDEGDAT